MNDLRKAAEEALKFCETLGENHWGDRKAVVDSLRAALAQPEQEPVLHKWAALFEDPNNDWQAGYESARRWVLEVGLQSIAAPPQRRPLTVKEIYEVCGLGEVDIEFVRIVEKAHGIWG